MVKPGRTFLRRLIDLSTKVKGLYHHIDITADTREDLRVWGMFLTSWNGQSFIPEPPVTSLALELFTDASQLGYGGFFKGQWFSEPWPSHPDRHIACLEFFAVFTAVSTWSYKLSNKQIVFTDNESIVFIWESGTTKDKPTMILVRELFFVSTKHNIHIIFRHIPGVINVYADLLSRLQVQEFKSACPESSPRPSTIPTTVFRVLDEIWKFT